eukprot:1327054-Amphidinium_carterae.1
MDTPTLEAHAAQLAATQAEDGAAVGSADAATSAAAAELKMRVPPLQHRSGKKMQQKATSAPMEAVIEEPQPSDAGSYRSFEEPEQTEEPPEQTEGPPEDE